MVMEARPVGTTAPIGSKQCPVNGEGNKLLASAQPSPAKKSNPTKLPKKVITVPGRLVNTVV